MGLVESLNFAMEQADKIKESHKFDKVVKFLLGNNMTTINDIIKDTNMKFIEVYNILQVLEQYEVIHDIKVDGKNRYEFGVRVINKFALENM